MAGVAVRGLRGPGRGGARLDSGVLLLPGLVVVAALFVLPFFFLVRESVQTPSGVGLSEYTALFGADNIFVEVVLRTVWIAALVALLTLILGYPLAYLATRLPGKWAALLLVCVVLPFFTAALVRAYAWQVLLANNGPVNKLLESVGIGDGSVRLMYNDFGVIVGTTQILLPMMVFPLYSTMRRIDRNLQRAAQSMGASPFTAWRTVFLPQTRAGISSGLSLVFLSALGYFITPMLLQGPSTPMLAQRIYSQITLPGKSASVAAQATVVLLLSVLVMFLLRRRLGIVLEVPSADSTDPTTIERRGWWHSVRRRVGDLGDAVMGTAAGGLLARVLDGSARLLSVIRYPLLGLAGAVGVAVLLAPIVIVFAVAFTDSAFLTFPPPGYSTRWFSWYFNEQDWLASTWLSAWMSVLAAVVATFIGSLAAFAIVRSRSRRIPTASYLLLTAPLVMPQIIFATALFYTLAPFRMLGTPMALILSYVVLGLPLVTIIMTAMFRGLDPMLERAAASLGATPAKVARTVVMPLAAPAILSALLFSFITGFDDLVMSQFLGSYNVVTLMRRLFENILFEVSPAVAAVGVLLIGCVIVLGTASLALTKRRRAPLDVE